MKQYFKKGYGIPSEQGKFANYDSLIQTSKQAQSQGNIF